MTAPVNLSSPSRGEGTEQLPSSAGPVGTQPGSVCPRQAGSLRYEWWAGELPAGRRDELLELCAEWVVRKGLEAPVLMFLEMHKPLTTLAAVTYAMGQPPLVLFFGFRRTEEVRLLLSERDNVEALMQRIELRSRACATDMPPQRGGLSVRPAAGTDEAAPNSRRDHIRGTREDGAATSVAQEGTAEP